MVTYAGGHKASGVQIYLNGQPVAMKILFDQNLEPIHHPKTPLRIGAGGGLRFTGTIEDVRIYDRALEATEAAVIASGNEREAPAEIRRAHEELLAVRRERQEFDAKIPSVMVMADSPSPRDTFLLKRGAYDAPGEKVTAGLPAALAAPRAEWSKDRLGLARWLVDRANPLTARVAVNRFWQSYFGVGIVKTVDDFGAQGEFPVHPELLDWLAVEFMESGWDVKALQKTIVMSAAYRQASRVTPELLQKDPDNRLLARGPRFRLGPEVIRDQALAVSGLLVEKVGGPSVKPYQPAGLWQELGGGSGYKQDQGEGLYRRSLYSYWKRTVAPPVHGELRFAQSRAVLGLRVPHQLAATGARTDERCHLSGGGPQTGGTHDDGGRRVGGRARRATATGWCWRARRTLRGGRRCSRRWNGFSESFRANAGAAREFLKQGESAVRPGLDEAELAAYAGVAGLLLNLDETITKE